jgi:hypothetical protein
MPVPGAAGLLAVSEVAMRFIFLALVISNVPILYQTFSRRERRSSFLGVLAGIPPTAAELLCPYHAGRSVKELRLLLVAVFSRVAGSQ